MIGALPNRKEFTSFGRSVVTTLHCMHQTLIKLWQVIYFMSDNNKNI